MCNFYLFRNFSFSFFFGFVTKVNKSLWIDIIYFSVSVSSPCYKSLANLHIHFIWKTNTLFVYIRFRKCRDGALCRVVWGLRNRLTLAELFGISKVSEPYWDKAKWSQLEIDFVGFISISGFPKMVIKTEFLERH